MREAVIVSYARTGLAKSARGGFNITPTVSMAAHAVKHAVAKSRVDPESVEDCFMGNVAHGGAHITATSATERDRACWRTTRPTVPSRPSHGLPFPGRRCPYGCEDTTTPSPGVIPLATG